MRLSEALALLASHYTHLRLRSGPVIALPPEPSLDGAAAFGIEPRGGELCLVNRDTGRVVGVAVELEFDGSAAAPKTAAADI